MESKALDLFFEIANLKVAEIGEGVSVYAGPLFRLVEMLATCEAECKVNLNKEAAQKVIVELLSDEIKSMKLLEELQKEAVRLITAFRDHKTISADLAVNFELVFPDTTAPAVFHFSVQNKAENKPKALLRAGFLNLVGFMGLEPDRFQNCDVCSNHFYQELRKSQIYCSLSCSNKARNLKVFKERTESKSKGLAELNETLRKQASGKGE